VKLKRGIGDEQADYSHAGSNPMICAVWSGSGDILEVEEK